jgi:hypothetical protein
LVDVADGSVWGRREHVAEVAGPGRVVLLDLEAPQGGPLVLEDSAAVVWDCLDGEHTVAQVCAEVAAYYEVPVGEVEVAVRDFVADMAARSLLVERPVE